jgi:hypothetical protein
VNRTQRGIALSAMMFGSLVACGGEDPGPLDGVDSIVFLQRPKRNEMGDIFQYTSYVPTGRLVKLSPPTADGQLTEICCGSAGAEFQNIDISGYDLSFDAKEIVFSGRLAGAQAYGLFVVEIETGAVRQLATNPNRDFVNPAYLPGDKIFFQTNDLDEAGAQQFRDEYERGTTLQMGVMNDDGTGLKLGPRNLSHRVFPTLLSDGRVMLTQWDHLGDMNAGHLVTVHPDMTTVREAFGKEGTGITNSYLKAREISPGRVVAIGSSRDRTLQSGAILDIRLGEPYSVEGKVLADRNMSEDTASYRLLTPSVPLGREPSSMTVGRYYDAFPLNAKDYPDLLVAWADGPVESGTLGAAGPGNEANFGVYLYDSQRRTRRPIYDDPAMWDIFPRPLVARDAPPVIAPSGTHGYDQSTTLIGSMDVHRSTVANLERGSVYGVRVVEGFSVEEGIPDDFGITEHEGAAVLGVAPVRADGSWLGLIPANIPVHLQAIDVFGMTHENANEPVWFSGAAGESRVCGGCHESRTDTVIIDPGLTEAVARGPTDLRSTTLRDQRVSAVDYSRDLTVGVPWDVALQGVFDAKCISCHNGTAGAANPTWTISDPMTGASFSWTFDLRGGEAVYGVGDEMFSGYSRSHLSLMGPDMMELEDAGLVITGEIKTYVEPGNARESELIKKLNPVQQFPTQSVTGAGAVRAFPTSEFPAHALAVGQELTADEYYLLVLMADLGGQYYSRENAPGN